MCAEKAREVIAVLLVYQADKILVVFITSSSDHITHHSQ